jgi:orotate phosphoribosyltransferase
VGENRVRLWRAGGKASSTTTAAEAPQLSHLQNEVIEIVRARGHQRLTEPVQLASGEMSLDFVDGKRALEEGEDLEKACRAMLELVDRIEFDAIGGLTLGADQFAHVMAVIAKRRWFVVRKAVKGRGTNRRVEGANLTQGVKALLVDDVVTTGSSIREAYDVITELGATVVGAVTLVDRGERASQMFRTEGIPYFAVATYKDLGIEPVGGGLVNA